MIKSDTGFKLDESLIFAEKTVFDLCMFATFLGLDDVFSRLFLAPLKEREYRYILDKD